MFQSVGMLVVFSCKEYIPFNMHIGILAVSVGKTYQVIHIFMNFSLFYKLMIGLPQNQPEGLLIKELWCIGLNLDTKNYLNE